MNAEDLERRLSDIEVVRTESDEVWAIIEAPSLNDRSHWQPLVRELRNQVGPFGAAI